MKVKLPGIKKNNNIKTYHVIHFPLVNLMQQQ